MKQKKTLREIMGNFVLEFQAKSTLFGHFVRDAHDWVRLYHCSLQKAGERKGSHLDIGQEWTRMINTNQSFQRGTR
jgi:hypothetical protein